jgi:hypothetical protein
MVSLSRFFHRTGAVPPVCKLEHIDPMTPTIRCAGERFMAMFYQSDSDADAVMEGDDEAPMQAEHPTRPVSQTAVTDCAARHKKKPSKAASIYSAGELEDDELRGQHDVETIFDTKKTEPRFPINARKRAHAIAAPSAIVQASTGHGDARTERKRFMSHKASVVAEGHAVNDGKNGKMFRNAADVADDGNLSRKEFRQMEREVLLYGEYGCFDNPLHCAFSFWCDPVSFVQIR